MFSLYSYHNNYSKHIAHIWILWWIIYENHTSSLLNEKSAKIKFKEQLYSLKTFNKIELKRNGIPFYVVLEETSWSCAMTYLMTVHISQHVQH